jgi:hypothetical protein
MRLALTTSVSAGVYFTYTYSLKHGCSARTKVTKKCGSTESVGCRVINERKLGTEEKGARELCTARLDSAKESTSKRLGANTQISIAYAIYYVLCVKIV